MEGGKPENLEKNAWIKYKNQQQTRRIYMYDATGAEIKPGPDWWESITLTTVPSLLL